jgi:two-component system cell cycle sensor histidine kinase/response regulator CckA
MMPSFLEALELPPAPVSILVVEDEAIIAREIATRLSRLGYLVAGTCRSGEEAIRETASKLPALVLMDIKLKGEMDGIQAAGEIHTRFDVPVVYVTSYSDAETLKRVKATDPFGFIVKPIAENALPSAIEMALSKHRLHQELKANFAFLFTTLKSIGDAVIATNRDGQVCHLNTAAETLTGWSEEEALGEDIDTVIHLVAEESNEPISVFGETGLKEHRVPGSPSTALLVFESGASIPIERTAAPISVDGVVLGDIVVFRDISVRRGLEQKLREAQKMETVGRLAGGVAHDFNNLLTVILGYGNEIRSQLAPNDSAWSSLKHIESAATCGAAVTRRLLSFSGIQVSEPQLLNLNATIVGLAGMFERLVGEWIRMETSLGAENATILGDKNQIEQLLMNLVLNARDAMPAGGQIRIATRDETISPAAAAGKALHVKPGPYCILTVEDNGVGIDEDFLPLIFEPYFTTKKVGSSGFGLSEVHSVVRQSGGEIQVSSMPGAGTTFEVYFPRAEQPVVAPPVQAPIDRLGTGIRALIVEDEPAILALLQSVFQAKGFDVLAAGNAEQALLAVKSCKGRIDLLVTDVRLPKADGVQLARLLKEQHPDARILFISGYLQEDLVTEIQFNVEARLLQKPFTSAEVFAEVEKLLRPTERPGPAIVQ